MGDFLKKILVTMATLPEFDEYVNEIRDIWESHWLTNMGVKHQTLQNELKRYLEVDKIELFTNGHMALEMALQALNLKGEVITTPFTFASTTHAIVRNCLTPVFCDINPDDFTIDVNKIESLITDKTCAIMPVHVYGNVCDVEAIEQIAQKHNLKVIYDACHTFGVKYKGIGTANFGDVSCFSFHATKVFNTIEGGAACFKDQVLGQKLYNLKNFGIHGPESVEAVGANAKLNEFCAAMGLCNLRHVNKEIEKRKKIYERYCQGLTGIPGIRFNKIKENVHSNYAYYPIVINPDEYGATRDDVMDKLAEHDIFVRKYFYPLTNEFDCYVGKGYLGDTPIAHRISQQVLTLPMYGDLSEDVVEKICYVIKNIGVIAYK